MILSSMRMSNIIWSETQYQISSVKKCSYTPQTQSASYLTNPGPHQGHQRSVLFAVIMATLAACVPFCPFLLSLFLRKIIFCLLLLLFLFLFFCSTVSFNKYSSKTRSRADEPAKTGAIKDPKKEEEEEEKRGLSIILFRGIVTRGTYCTVITTM